MPSKSLSVVNSGWFGNYYQSLIGILRLLDLLNNNGRYVVFEKKDSKYDIFDDVKIFFDSEIHHYQIKFSYTDNPLKISNFTNDGIGLFLPNIFSSWKETQNQNNDKKNIFHIYTTKPILEGNVLQKYLKKVNDNRNILSLKPESVYEISTSILDDPKLKNIKEYFTNYDEFKTFLESLVIEIEQPTTPNSKNIHDLLSGELGKIILEKIMDLELHKAPFNVDPINIFDHLYRFVNESSINSLKIEKKDIENVLKIAEKFKVIENIIELDEKEYVKTQNNFETLNSLIKDEQKKVIIINGKPGSGKTWFLTKWINEFKEEHKDTPPIWYYSSIAVTGDDDFEIRITEQQLLNNLIFSIKESYELSFTDNTYGYTSEKLQKIINDLGNIAKKKNQVIPIIIDGLDHINRILTRTTPSIQAEKTILDLVEKIEIPDGICLILGSQEGSHLDSLKEKYGENIFFEILGFNLSEMKTFLEKLPLPEGFVEEKQDEMYEKTKGLPLLVNYLSRRIIQTKNFTEISEIPMTDGNIGVYYDYLWGKLSESTPPRKFARFFALLEFPINTVFLNQIIPEESRDGEELEKCISPLIFLLRKNSENEMSIFHDSFREHILKKTDFKINLQEQYTKDIYKKLKENGFIQNQKSFRYGLNYGLKCRNYLEILEIVNLEFIDKSIINLNNKKDLENNIRYAIHAAHELEDPIQVLTKGLLKKYTLERYEYLELYRFDNLILKLFPDKIQNYLIFEDKLNLSLADTMWFLAKCVELKISVDIQKIMQVWNQSITQTKYGRSGHLPKEISLSAYGLILCNETDLKTVVEWILKNNFDINTASEIVLKIIKIISYEKIVPLKILKEKYGEKWVSIEIQILYYYKKYEDLCLKLEEYFEKSPQIVIDELSEILKYAKLSKNKIKNVNKTVEIDHPRYSEINIKNILEFQNQICLFSYMKDSEGLEKIRGNIYKQHLHFFVINLEFLYQINRVTVYDTKLITLDMVNSIYQSISEFVNYSDYRIFDEPGYNNKGFAKILSNAIKKSFQIILEKGNNELKNKLIELIPKFRHKYMFTFLNIQNIIEFVFLYSSDERLKEEALTKIPDDSFAVETQDEVDFYLSNAHLYFLINDNIKTKNNFDKAIKNTFSYGYHKDLLLEEVRSILELIPNENYLEKIQKILEFSEYLEVITDGDETHHIHIDALIGLVKKFPSKGFKISLEYGIDSYEFGEVLSAFSENCKNCDILVRYFLLKTRLVHTHPHRYSPEYGFDERITIINQGIQNEQISEVKIMLDDLKIELTRDFPEVKNDMIIQFNNLVKNFDISPIEIHSSITPKPQQKYEKENIQNLSVEELYKKFNHHYGWSWGSGKIPEEILVLAYKNEPSRTNQFVIDSLTDRCLNNSYEPSGGIQRYATYLSNTNQTENILKLYSTIEEFTETLFRDKKLKHSKNFEIMLQSKEQYSDTEVGFKFLFSRLHSNDTKIINIAVTSISKCLIYDVSGFLEWCLDRYFNENNLFVKERIASIFDIYVTSSIKSSPKLIECAKKMKSDFNRNIVNSGTNILKILNVDD